MTELVDAAEDEAKILSGQGKRRHYTDGEGAVHGEPRRCLIQVFS